MAQCMFPNEVERKLYFSQSDRMVKVPCGKCPNCLKRRLASWSFRLEVEALQWPIQHFVTLTYNTSKVPISPNTFLTLEPDHLTKFFKRLRKRSGKLKYYAVGEYGTQNKRPHYHLILFGNESLTHNDIIHSWADPNDHQPYGDVYFGKVEAASIKYCVQYYDKGDWYPSHKRDDRHPEFSRCSEGLGKSFLTWKTAKHLLENPQKGYIYNSDGHKISIPRYYRKRLYDYLMHNNLVAAHPSLLVHRDDMLALKVEHNEAMAKIMGALEQPEITAELFEDRKAAINNHRASKRKTRK